VLLLEAYLQPFYAVVIFEVGCCFLLELAWTAILLVMLPTLAGLTGTHNHVQLFPLRWAKTDLKM
jgi:hypothetical protein